MLFPEQVRPFLLHEDWLLREQARDYFHGAFDFGEVTADDYWDVIERFGDSYHTHAFAADLRGLPQTDSSLQRLLNALAAKPSKVLDSRLQVAARDMELAVVLRHREAMLGCPQLLDHVRAHLQLRLDLLDETPTAAWDRLMRRGIELHEAHVGKFDTSLSDALIEAAARGGAAVCEQALQIVVDPQAQIDWRAIFATRVLGIARYEPGLNVLVDLLNVDDDLLPEMVNDALTRIGSVDVIDRIVAFYVGKPWRVRISAYQAMSRIKRPESEAGLLKLLEMELAFEADLNNYEDDEPLSSFILLALADLGSMAGLRYVREERAEYPDSPDTFELCKHQLAIALMTGVTLPEEAAWRKEAEASQQRLAKAISGTSDWLDQRLDRWRETGQTEPPGPSDWDDVLDDEPQFELVAPSRESSRPAFDRLKPIRNTAPKIGRNDPCTCGSGKKYKKCCGKP